MKVLIAEDDPVIALGLAERVRSLGHEALGPAADGAEAVVLARADTPDLYLFDIEMPNLDGLEAAEQLAAEGLRRPVVVVTGVEDESLVERSIASGVGAYLTKPVDTRELQAAPGPRPHASSRVSSSWKRRSTAPSRRSRTARSSSAPRDS